MSLSCRICQNTENNRIHIAREMMFGMRDEFEYLECGKCGTIQIVEVPDLSKYYPEDYYSFDQNGKPEVSGNFKDRAAVFVSKLRLKYGRNHDDLKIPGYHSRSEIYSRIFDFGCNAGWVFDVTADPDIRILDFGCGSGKLLNTLSYFGYRNLTGIDAFIKTSITRPNGVRIIKGSLQDIDGEFDLIMFHHSFEHLPDPLETLIRAKDLLSDRGLCMIRIPLVNYAWGKYGVNWVALDPPRHLFLFTEKSFSMLVEQAGFSIENVVFDSSDFQFRASEQYKKNVPLNMGKGRIFSYAQILKWKWEAARLNSEGRGDQACFYLRKN